MAVLIENRAVPIELEHICEVAPRSQKTVTPQKVHISESSGLRQHRILETEWLAYLNPNAAGKNCCVILTCFEIRIIPTSSLKIHLKVLSSEMDPTEVRFN